jgi:hypothetical protein
MFIAYDQVTDQNANAIRRVRIPVMIISLWMYESESRSCRTTSLLTTAKARRTRYGYEVIQS